MLQLSFRNTAAVIANIYATDDALQEAVVAMVHEAGQYCKDLAYFYSPVDTGFMREHLRVIYGPKGYSFEVGWLQEDFLSAGLAFYPVFQEFGTRFMSAQPSLTPAYQDTTVWFLPALSAELNAAVERRRAA